MGSDPMNPQSWRVSLLAGSPAGTTGYVDALAHNALFNDPHGIAVGRNGTVFVADTENNCIRQITPDGSVTTLAGTNTAGYVDATGGSARFDCPRPLDVGPGGYIYVGDRYNRRIRRISPAHRVTTVAGTGSAAHMDGRGDESGHFSFAGIAVGPSGNLYVSEGTCIRVVERIIDVGNAG
jgi:hypothetical protein